MARILLVDDDPDLRMLVEEELAVRGYELAGEAFAEDALARLRTESFDVMVTDLNLAGTSGIALCERVVSMRPDLPVIVLTGFGDVKTAIAAMRAGAFDFITKRDNTSELADELAMSLERAIQDRALRKELTLLREAVAHSRQSDEMIGSSPRMQELFALLERVSDSNATVLITGESGTGKELVTRAIHRRSKRRDGPLVAINCGAVPEALLESELFGHAKGAFTDAKSARDGVFVQAHKGTLLLDEIGEMPLPMQVKLLRALQERAVRPVGSGADVPVDVRIAASTHRDLDAAVEAGLFRRDLYFRINVIHVEVPALRERGNDVLLVAQHFIRHYATQSEKRVTGFAHAVAERLLAYDWPGNVRELQNCVERAVTLTRYEEITVDDLPAKIQNYKPSQFVISTDSVSDLLPIDQIERRYILRVMECVRGNKRLAARVLGVDRKTLYRRLERYGVMSPKT